MKNAAHKIDTDSLKGYEMLNRLSQSDARELLSTSLTNTLSAGTPVFSKGDDCKQLFFLMEGEVELVTENRGTRLIKAGTPAARHPMGSHLPNQLAARATSDCLLLSFDADMLDLFLNWTSPGAYQVNEVNTDKDHAWANQLLSSRALLHFSEEHVERLLQRMHAIHYNAGDVVIQQDDLDDKYFIIKTGSCEVTRQPDPNTKAIKLASLKEGDAFGEEALLAETPRNATVTMKEPGTLMSLSKGDFSELLADPFLSTINWNECQGMFDTGAVLIDIRPQDEFNAHHLPGSSNLPLPLLRLKIKQLDARRKYIVICQDGSMSSVAGFLLSRNGYEAYILDGGLNTVEQHSSAAPSNAIADAPQTDDTQEHKQEQTEMSRETPPAPQHSTKNKVRSLADSWGDTVDDQSTAPVAKAKPTPAKAIPAPANKGTFIASGARRPATAQAAAPSKDKPSASRRTLPIKTIIAAIFVAAAIPFIPADMIASVKNMVSPPVTPVMPQPPAAAGMLPPMVETVAPASHQPDPVAIATPPPQEHTAPAPPDIHLLEPEPLPTTLNDGLEEMIGDADVYFIETAPVTPQVLDPATRGLAQP